MGNFAKVSVYVPTISAGRLKRWRVRLWQWRCRWKPTLQSANRTCQGTRFCGWRKLLLGFLCGSSMARSGDGEAHGGFSLCYGSDNLKKVLCFRCRLLFIIKFNLVQRCRCPLSNDIPISSKSSLHPVAAGLGAYRDGLNPPVKRKAGTNIGLNSNMPTELPSIGLTERRVRPFS